MILYCSAEPAGIIWNSRSTSGTVASAWVKPSALKVWVGVEPARAEFAAETAHCASGVPSEVVPAEKSEEASARVSTRSATGPESGQSVRTA